MADKGLIPQEIIENKIYLIRDQRVMLDSDLARLYEVDTKVLNQAVKRNIDNFPADFMFQLTEEENISLRSQIVTLKRGQHRKYTPYAFTEHGVLMLSSVLKSSRAIQVNIQIMRVFVQLRKILQSNEKLRKQLEKIEEQLGELKAGHDSHDEEIQVIFKVIRQLTEPTESENKTQIGFVKS